jgi:hypothetical protein
MVVTVFVVPAAELLFVVIHSSPQIVAQFVFRLYVCMPISTVVSPVVRSGMSVVN